MKLKKIYAIRNGRKRGIFYSWVDCKKQVDKFPGAEFKSFITSLEAKNWLSKSNKEEKLTSKKDIEFTEPIKLNPGYFPESISVDGSCNTYTGIIEYKGVKTSSGKPLFKIGPIENGTNNIAEFLALVHALAYCKQKNLNIPIYSDSKVAINWVQGKNINTSRNRNNQNEIMFDLLDRAIKWLKENEYSNQILKWNTKSWGENPADFGRKNSYRSKILMNYDE